MPPPEIHVCGVVCLTERAIVPRRKIPRSEAGDTFVVHVYPDSQGWIAVRDYRAPSIGQGRAYQIWMLAPGEWGTAQ